MDITTLKLYCTTISKHWFFNVSLLETILVLNEVLNIIRWIISPARPQYLAIVRTSSLFLPVFAPCPWVFSMNSLIVSSSSTSRM